MTTAPVLTGTYDWKTEPSLTVAVHGLPGLRAARPPSDSDAAAEPDDSSPS